MDKVCHCLCLLCCLYHLDVAAHGCRLGAHPARRAVHPRLLHHEEGAVAVVERGVQSRPVHHELGRCPGVRSGCRVFHQPVPLPELRHPLVVAGEEPAYGRLPVCVETQLRPAHPADTAHYAPHAAHAAHHPHQELHRVAPLGLPPHQGAGPCAAQRHRGVQLSRRRLHPDRGPLPGAGLLRHDLRSRRADLPAADPQSRQSRHTLAPAAVGLLQDHARHRP